MESFGIPDPAATTSALAGVVTANNSAMRSVALDATAPLGTAVSQNDALLGQVASTVNRSLAARVSGNANQINTVGNALAGNLAGTVGSNQAQLNSASLPAIVHSTPTSCKVWVNDRAQEATFACSDLDLSSHGFRQPTSQTYPDVQSALNAAVATGYRVVSLPEAAAVVYSTTPASLPQKPAGAILGSSGLSATSNPVGVQPIPVVPAVPVSPVVPAPLPALPSGEGYYCLTVSANPDLGTATITRTLTNITAWWKDDNHFGLEAEPAGTNAAGIALDILWVTANGVRQSRLPGLYLHLFALPAGIVAISPGACSSTVPLPPSPAAPPAPSPPGSFTPIWEQPPPPEDEIPTGPVTIGVLGCEFPTYKGAGKVGSELWCRNAEELLGHVQAIGKQLKRFFLGLVSDSSDKPDGFIVSVFKDYIGSKVLGYEAVKQLPAIFNAVATDRIKAIWECMQATVNSLSVCNAEASVAIALVRGVLGLLKHARGGWDAFVWITLDFALTLPELEQYLEYLGRMTCPVEIPAVPDAIECWLRNTVPEPQFRCWMLMRGCDPEVWIPVLSARREQLMPEETIELARRHNLPVAAQGDLLRQLGWLDPQERANKVELYDELPTIADHLHWLQRNVFDVDYVRDYHLEDGFAEKFWPEFGPDLRAQGMLERYAKKHYAAHWILPAPGQLQEFVYRLRPGKDGVANPFSIADYERMLTEQDVAPYFRPRFAEIIHKLPALTYAREQYFQFLWTDEQLKSYHQDLGYSPDDSDRFVAIDKIQRARRRAGAGHGWTPGAIAKAYAAGFVDDKAVTAQMDALGYTAGESNLLMKRAKSDLDYQVFTRARSRVMSGTVQHIRKALRIGVIDQPGASAALVNLGWDKTRADAIASLESAMADTDRTAKVVNRLRSAFHAGEIDANYAQQALGQIGIVPGAIQSYLTSWAVEQTPNRKRRTASQIVADVSTGLLTTADALARLANLGYGAADQMLYLADAQAAVRKVAAKNLAQQQKQSKQSAAATQKLINDNLRLQKSLRNRLNRLAPPSKLKKFAIQGTMNESTYRARMAALGFDPVDINRYWLEIISDKKYTPASSVNVGPGEPGVTGGPIPPI